MRKGSCLYLALPRRVAYALQEPLWEEQERLQKKQIIVPLDADETSEWCSSFVLVPKANVKVRLCLSPAHLNKVLLTPIHRGPTLNHILPRLAGVKCFRLDVSSGYHNLKPDKQSSYITPFLVRWVYTGTYDCHLVWYRLEICFREKNEQAVPWTAQQVWHCKLHSYCRVPWIRQRSWCYTQQGPEDMQAGQPRS